MKGKILITVLMILMTFNAQSQKRQDSTAVPDGDLRALLMAFDEWRTLKPENALLLERVDLLHEKIALKDSTIGQQEKIILLQRLNLEGMAQNEKILLAQRNDFQKQTKSLTKKLKASKTKTFISSIAGIVGIVTIFLIK